MTTVKHVMITGSSTGIGAACALRLDRLGYGVFAGVRNPADGERLQERASECLTPVLIDVTDSESVARAAHKVTGLVGEAGIYALINNAGIAVVGPLEGVGVEGVRRQLEVNVLGQLAVINAFLPLLRRGSGRIINMGSISGRVVVPIFGAYAVSKYALEAMSDALRMELRESGIFVTIIEPGLVETPIWERSMNEGRQMLETLPEAVRTRYEPLIRAVEHATAKGRRRAVSAEQVAKVVCAALSARRPKARYLVGRDAKLMAHLLGRLPDRLRDFVILRMLGGGRS